MTSKKKENIRDKVVHFTLNEKELDLMSFYIKKYKIENRSRWIRESLLAHILKNLEKDYPTLFEENEMRR